VSLAILAGLIVGAIFLFSSKDWGAKFGGIAAGVAVLYAAYQVRLTRLVAKRTLSYEYFARFSRYSLQKPYAIAKKFSLPSPSNDAEAQARWEEFQRWKRDNADKERDLIFIFNFFEELGGQYRVSAVDRGIINEYLGRFACSFWDALHWWFIPRIRKERTPTLWEDWEGMVRAVEAALARKSRWP
jgi:hypothetical protein